MNRLDCFSERICSWLVLGNNAHSRFLVTYLNQLIPASTLLLAASKQLPPLQMRYINGDCPALLYGLCLKAEDTDMFVFQYLSSLSGPWKGIIIPDQSRHVFLGAYLARFLTIPLIIELNQKQNCYSEDLIWALSTLKCCLVSENRQILAEFNQFNPLLQTCLMPCWEQIEQGSSPAWVDLLQNKHINFE